MKVDVKFKWGLFGVLLMASIFHAIFYATNTVLYLTNDWNLGIFFILLVFAIVTIFMPIDQKSCRSA